MCHSPGAVVVLGGTGFVGSAITRGLVAGGYDVTVAARRLPVDLDRLSGARVVQRDAADPPSMTSCSTGPLRSYTP